MTPRRTRIPKLDESKIERSRPAGIDAGQSEIEAALAFNMRAARVPAPLTEHRFFGCCAHPSSVHDEAGCTRCAWGAGHEYSGRDWRFDFAWPDLRLAVECEGGVWTQGRHTRGSGFVADIEKYNAAALAGWLVLRVTDEMVESGEALELVERALAARRTS